MIFIQYGRENRTFLSRSQLHENFQKIILKSISNVYDYKIQGYQN